MITLFLLYDHYLGRGASVTLNGCASSQFGTADLYSELLVSLYWDTSANLTIQSEGETKDTAEQR